MCPTLLGRLQTRFAILIIPAIIGAIISLATGNPAWVAVIGVYLVMGCTLDIVVYRPVFSWQPGWLTFVLAVGEWVLLLVLVLTLNEQIEGVFDLSGFIDNPIIMGSIYYWFVWVTAQCVRIVLLPLIFLTRIEDGGELRRPEWTVPAQMQQLPVLASAGAQLPERLSGVWQRPNAAGQALPPPSQIAQIPPEFLAAVRHQQPR